MRTEKGKHRRWRRWRARLNLSFAIVAYCAFFHWAYVVWIVPTSFDDGFTYDAPSTPLLVLAYLLAVGVSLASPLLIRRASQVIYWLLFLTVFIPSLFIPLFVGLQDTATLLMMQLCLGAAMLTIAFCYRLPLLAIPRFKLSSQKFWVGFAVLYVLFNGTVLFVFRNALQFASVETMYDIRYQQNQVLGGVAGRGQSITAYMLIALVNVFNPLLICYGALKGRWRLVALGCAGEIFIYLAAAAKSVILAPVLVLVCYYTLKRDRGGWVPKIAYVFAGASSLPVLGLTTGIFFALGFLFLVRSTALPGLFYAQYQHFFEVYPHTYLGHVRGFSLFFPYKFQLPMGMEISKYYGASFSDLGIEERNASFFSTDGIGGFGLPGVVLMGFLAGLTLWLFDSCARKAPPVFSSAATIAVATSLTNVSLFTTLLSNDLLLWMLVFLLLPSEFFDQTARPQRRRLFGGAGPGNERLPIRPPSKQALFPAPAATLAADDRGRAAPIMGPVRLIERLFPRFSQPVQRESER